MGANAKENEDRVGGSSGGVDGGGGSSGGGGSGRQRVDKG